ncbi:HDOD domain-containing protein [Thermovibrio ammonificans]
MKEPKISRTVLLRLIKALMEEEELSTVAEIASADPNLAAKLLQFANSAYAGLKRRISSIKDAIAFIGLKKLKEIAVTLLATSLLTEKDPTKLKELLRTAYIMKMAAKRQVPSLAEEAFMVGILYPVYRETGQELLNMLKEACVSEEVVEGLTNPNSPLGILLKFALAFNPYCRKIIEGEEKEFPLLVGGFKKEFLVKVCFDADIEAEKVVQLL